MINHSNARMFGVCKRDTNREESRRTVFFFVKFLRSEEHVEGLLSGWLYAQRLSRFKQSEGRFAPGRLDPDEGTSSWMQPDRVGLEVNGWKSHRISRVRSRCSLTGSTICTCSAFVLSIPTT